MTKDVIDAILERRSIRNFKRGQIPQATIGRILEAAAAAPSAGNVQPWEFYVVLKKEIKSLLAEAAYNQPYLTEAPVVIVVCADPGMSGQRYGTRGETLYCLQDTAAAVQNILLAANGYGLGSCWIGAFDEARVAQIMELPKNLRPVAMIPLGFAEEARDNHPPRRSVDEVVHVLE